MNLPAVAVEQEARATERALRRLEIAAQQLVALDIESLVIKAEILLARGQNGN